MKRWQLYSAVGAGCAIGSVFRYLLSLGMWAALGGYFPWGTLTVNVLGSCIIAWVAAKSTYASHGGIARWQPFLAVGFCGGLTTFSLFGLETLYLYQQQLFLLAALYVITSLLAWLLAAWLGDRLARQR
ncbi:CrcB family protein [Halomonas sp. SH5A2]|uniref:fluoride efflux transporter FluC n=1 Tax=Halomonas sp. SH5A2 TaxID=2749040 RepID=UPI001641E396|nr:CrcB family protein [Halomonas sp. SH5A2]QNI03875.1 CrcB family protein [Halomonas sp. SH5A2]